MMRTGAKEMIKDALAKIARAVGATVFAVGIAVMLGVATTALAAVPGDPLKLGQLNSINALTRLAGSNTGAIFVVDNDSAERGARAVDLRVEPGKPPLTVNSAARTATNLSADELDGLDSSELKIGCPSGTTLFGGACIETAPRTLGADIVITSTFPDASSDCADEGRRLPTAAELEAFRQQPGITLGSGSIGEWAADFLDANTALRVSDSGGYSGGTVNGTTQGLGGYRCVASPSG